MSQPSPEHFPDQIIDAYLEAQTRYPQTATGTTLAVGSAAMPSILFDGYTWSRFMTDTLSDEQLDRVVAKINIAHGSTIPFRPGLSEGEEDGVKIFPTTRVNELIHSAALEVGYITIDMLHCLGTNPLVGEHRIYSLPEQVSILQDRTSLRPAEIGAIATLFTSAHESLNVSNEKTLSLRRDLHRNLRDFYSRPSNYDEDALKNMEDRMSDLVVVGVASSLPRVDAWLGRTVPAIFSSTFLKKVVKGVEIPRRQ